LAVSAFAAESRLCFGVMPGAGINEIEAAIKVVEWLDLSVLRLKSRPGGWLNPFVCDTVLTYKEVRCAPVLDQSLYPTHHDDF
jgi:hypothetical protein